MFSNVRRPPMPIRYLSSLTSLSLEKNDDGVRLSKALIDNGLEVLKQLMELQSKGWQDESAKCHFQHQRQEADNASTDLTVVWFRQMKVLLHEIDKNLAFVPVHEPLKFLDLGCCPGGFSSYVLDKNTKVVGFGISLPVDDGGHQFSLKDHHCSQFKLSYKNLTYYQLGPSVINDRHLQPLPDSISAQSFDLALLDGHQLRTQASVFPWDHNCLLISQLVIGLQAVKEGGTVVIKLPLPHRPMSAKILFLFGIISEQILCWKPKSMHANWGTFYAVAKGIGNGQEGQLLPSILLDLKKLWFSMMIGGEEGTGRYINANDFDFIIGMDDLIDHHLDWIMQLGAPLWGVQENAL